jgi:hypothetical protein
MNSVEVGVKFQADVAGLITGIRFYKGALNTGSHVASLWDSSGVLLASATFTSETATGWQQVLFASPVSIQANTTYTASYHASKGEYADTQGFFGSAVNSPPLHALASASSGGNGVYVYSVSTAFPTSTYLATNYWVDVVFVPTTSATSSATPTFSATATRTPTFTPAPTPSPTLPAMQTPTPSASPTVTPVAPSTVTTRLGVTTIGTTQDTFDSNYLTGSRIVTGAAPLTTSSISAYIGGVDSVGHDQFGFAIYSDSGGSPSALLTQTSNGTLIPNAWNTLPVTVALAPNTAYWLMYNTNGTSGYVNNMYNAADPARVGAFAPQTFGSWPSSATGLVLAGQRYSIFVTAH